MDKKKIKVACDTCMHNVVCERKNIFKDAQESLDKQLEASVRDWIDIQPLKCCYYLKDFAMIRHD